MRGDNKVTVFASGNGDTVMIEAHRQTILTDIHYRRNQAEDPENDRVPDFASDIRAACPDDHLHVFVLTHPDKDHLGGWSDLFHCGQPENWVSDPEDGEPKIIVDEIWCTPYSVNPHYVTDPARPLIDEIKRRNKLRGTNEGQRDGNRLVVMDTSTHGSGSIVAGLEWRLLAPTKAEWNIPKAPEGETPTSSNPTSIVMQWTVSVSGTANLIFIGGDSSVQVMDRESSARFTKGTPTMSRGTFLSLSTIARAARSAASGTGATSTRSSRNRKPRFEPSASNAAMASSCRAASASSEVRRHRRASTRRIGT